jgi:hypothetical protein
MGLHTESGRLAQLGERCVRNAEVGGSIPPPSTNFSSKRARFRFLTRAAQWTRADSARRPADSRGTVSRESPILVLVWRSVQIHHSEVAIGYGADLLRHT